MEQNHIVVNARLGTNPAYEPTLCDTGATGFAFIDAGYSQLHNLPRYQLDVPRSVDVINGRPIVSGDITHAVKLPLTIGNHEEEITPFVTTLGHHTLVLGVPWMRKHDIKIDFAHNTVEFNSEFCAQHCLTSPTKVTSMLQTQETPTIQVHSVSATSYRRIIKNRNQRYGKIHAFSLSLYDIHQALNDKEPTEEEVLASIPETYKEFLPRFRKVNADKLPPHCTQDYSIDLKGGFTPPFGPLYCLSRPELEALRNWLQENLSKGFIRTSSSPAACSILFVKKGDGSLRLCVDYRALNEGTIKNRYPLPLIKETLMRLSEAKWFTKLNVRGAYNLIRIKEGDE